MQGLVFSAVGPEAELAFIAVQFSLLVSYIKYWGKHLSHTHSCGPNLNEWKQWLKNLACSWTPESEQFPIHLSPQSYFLQFCDPCICRWFAEVCNSLWTLLPPLTWWCLEMGVVSAQITEQTGNQLSIEAYLLTLLCSCLLTCAQWEKEQKWGRSQPSPFRPQVIKQKNQMMLWAY